MVNEIERVESQREVLSDPHGKEEVVEQIAQGRTVLGVKRVAMLGPHLRIMLFQHKIQQECPRRRRR